MQLCSFLSVLFDVVIASVLLNFTPLLRYSYHVSVTLTTNISFTCLSTIYLARRLLTRCHCQKQSNPIRAHPAKHSQSEHKKRTRYTTAHVLFNSLCTKYQPPRGTSSFTILRYQSLASKYPKSYNHSTEPPETPLFTWNGWTRFIHGMVGLGVSNTNGMAPVVEISPFGAGF